jgi:hypothetical protein
MQMIYRLLVIFPFYLISPNLGLIRMIIFIELPVVSELYLKLCTWVSQIFQYSPLLVIRRSIVAKLLFYITGFTLITNTLACLWIWISDSGSSFTEVTNSVYFSITTLVTLGYGDINVTNTQMRSIDYLIVMAMMVCGLINFTYTQTLLVTLLRRWRDSSAHMSEEIENFQDWLAQRQKIESSMTLKFEKKLLLNFRHTLTRGYNQALSSGHYCEKLDSNTKEDIVDRVTSDFISHNILLKNLSKHVSQELLTRMTPMNFCKEEKIVSKGQKPEGVYLIVSGWVELMYQTNGMHVVCDIAGKGDIFGEMCLSDKAQQFEYQVGDFSELHTLFIPVEELHDMLAESPIQFRWILARIQIKQRNHLKSIGILEKLANTTNSVNIFENANPDSTPKKRNKANKNSSAKQTTGSSKKETSAKRRAQARGGLSTQVLQNFLHSSDIQRIDQMCKEQKLAEATRQLSLGTTKKRKAVKFDIMNVNAVRTKPKVNKASIADVVRKSISVSTIDIKTDLVYAENLSGSDRKSSDSFSSEDSYSKKTNKLDKSYSTEEFYSKQGGTLSPIHKILLKPTKQSPAQQHRIIFPFYSHEEHTGDLPVYTEERSSSRHSELFMSSHYRHDSIEINQFTLFRPMKAAYNQFESEFEKDSEDEDLLPKGEVKEFVSCRKSNSLPKLLDLIEGKVSILNRKATLIFNNVVHQYSMQSYMLHKQYANYAVTWLDANEEDSLDGNTNL